VGMVKRWKWSLREKIGDMGFDRYVGTQEQNKEEGRDLYFTDLWVRTGRIRRLGQ
jgi:hypothetical protein